MTVAQLDRSMPSGELSYWIAYDKIECLSDRREDLRQAKIGCIVVNTIRGLFGMELISMDEFLLKLAPPPAMSTHAIRSFLENHPLFTKVD